MKVLWTRTKGSTRGKWHLWNLWDINPLSTRVVCGTRVNFPREVMLRVYPEHRCVRCGQGWRRPRTRWELLICRA